MHTQPNASCEAEWDHVQVPLLVLPSLRHFVVESVLMLNFFDHAPKLNHIVPCLGLLATVFALLEERIDEKLDFLLMMDWGVAACTTVWWAFLWDGQCQRGQT
jgi:hypothetical protein